MHAQTGVMRERLNQVIHCFGWKIVYQLLRLVQISVRKDMTQLVTQLQPGSPVCSAQPQRKIGEASPSLLRRL